MLCPNTQAVTNGFSTGSGGVQDHFPQNVLKFGFGDWKNVYEKRRPNPIFPKIPENWMSGWGKMGKKVYEKRGKQVFVLTNWRCINYYQGFFAYKQDFSCIILYVLVIILSS